MWWTEILNCRIVTELSRFNILVSVTQEQVTAACSLLPQTTFTINRRTCFVKFQKDTTFCFLFAQSKFYTCFFCSSNLKTVTVCRVQNSLTVSTNWFEYRRLSITDDFLVLRHSWLCGCYGSWRRWPRCFVTFRHNSRQKPLDLSTTRP